MKIHSTILSIALLLSGCANVQQSRIDMLPNSNMAVGESRLQLSVKGGYWQDFRANFDIVTGERIELLMSNPNFHEKWAPTQAICVRATGLSKEICVHVRPMNADKGQLAVIETVSNTDRTKILESRPIVGKFPVGVRVVVAISMEKDALNLRINNEISVRHELDFEPAILMMGCSSVECSFRFLD
jgi:hypothetical protein